MATSPPFNSTSPIIAKKRPFASPSTLPSKRRKPSTGPSHLRQTSYPPDEPDLRDGTRSPSVDVENMSIISGATGTTNRRRRGAKAASVISASVANGTPGANANDENVEEDDDEDDGAEFEGKLDAEDQERNRRNQATLFNKLSEEEKPRFEQWRGVKLKRDVVRRLTNQTLSQSVPASVVISIQSYTKAFLAEIIDRAHDVQEEWMVSARALPTGDPINKDTPLADRLQDRDKTPLTPDMLREALRRYKRDRVGGSAGFLGLSLAGKDVTAPKMNGRPLFR